ncbi:alpha/beta fold hydrolase [Pseudonocardia humida]|uniref:alpha/beta fold hydrolase n=1 Tax=Pseudonocardia humida TaxID=2800819 RepID=UPI00207C11DE|nr:alpha/beta fold hydrolase [Pseudonocardia humida]
MRTLALPAATLAYDDLGPATDAAPLLLVHGHPFDRSMWRGQLSRFASRRVIAPDLRGYGASTGSVERWSDLADDLVDLLDALRVPRAVVVGLSMGGQIALDLAVRHPARVAGLLLADTMAGADPDAPGRRAAADRLLREGMDPYAVENLYRMVRPGSPAAVAEHVLAMMRETDPTGAAAAQRARADRPDLLAALGRLDLPTTVVVGADDAFTPVSDARAIADAIPGAELVVVAGAAHMPNLEQPAAFDAALTRLLTRIP